MATNDRKYILFAPVLISLSFLSGLFMLHPDGIHAWDLKSDKAHMQLNWNRPHTGDVYNVGDWITFDGELGNYNHCGNNNLMSLYFYQAQSNWYSKFLPASCEVTDVGSATNMKYLGYYSVGIYRNTVINWEKTVKLDSTMCGNVEVGFHAWTSFSLWCHESSHWGYAGNLHRTIYIPCPVCGDGTVQSPNHDGLNEQCDDGNTTNGDGCSSTCQFESQPSASVDADKYVIAKGEGKDTIVNLIATGKDLLGQTALEFMTLHYRRVKNSDEGVLSTPDPDWTTFATVSCYDINCSAGYSNDLKWDVKNLPSGYYEIAVNAHSVDGNKCTGNHSCDYSNAGPGEYACWDWLDCDPAHPPGKESDYVVIRVTECGNGTVEPGEDCDGGSDCNAQCEWASCGDKVVQKPNHDGMIEDCDDGNTSARDYCNACKFTYCGDGIKQSPNGRGINVGEPGFTESCDDGNNLDGDGCSKRCEEEGLPWLMTLSGDVYSADGYYIPGMPADEYISSYLCLSSRSTFDVGGGCSTYSLFDLHSKKPIGDKIHDTVTQEINSVFNRAVANQSGYSGEISFSGNLSTNVNVDTPRSISGKNIQFAKNLVINEEITFNGSAENSEALLYFVSGNLTIAPTVRNLVGYYIVKGEVLTPSSSDLIPLTIDGGVISIKNMGFGRTLGIDNASNPAETLIYDPRYIDIFRDFLGEPGNVQYVESGAI